MKLQRMVILSLVFCVSTLYGTQLRAGEANHDTSRLALVPWPKTIEIAEGELTLEKDARIVASDDGLLPLATILSDEIFLATGLRLTSVQGEARDGDVLLTEEPSRGSTHEGAYELLIDKRAVVRGADYAAIARGTVTLLQAIELTDDKVRVPRMSIRDWPHFVYCGTLLDVSRKPYSIETLKQCVDVCRFYKIRFI